MKSYIKIVLLSLSVLAFGATGCLKDDEFEDGEIQSLRSQGSQKVIEMSLTTTSTDNYLNIAVDNFNRDTTFNLIPITLADGKPAPEDIRVTVVPNAALLGNYNADHGTAHEVAPASLYTIINPAVTGGPGYVVTIPKGTNTAYLQIKINPSNFLGNDYALGFQISKVEPAGYLVSSNLGTGIVAIGIKNQYDGIYSIKGYALRAGDAALTGNFTDREMPLITSGATSVRFGTLPLWGDGNSYISVGNPNLQINTGVTLPDGSNPVTITSPGGAINAPGYDTRYHAPTRTFYISFTWGAGPTQRLAIDTMTYLRPR
ncbi:MAG: DUF1735 domain-containing protein [Chitinophagaceae bacterium]